jgi:hypothetical protein
VADISPANVLRQVAGAIPVACHTNIVIVGSLAAGYQLLKDEQALQVRTKDVDCVISPRVTAADRGAAVAERLLREGWALRSEGSHSTPGSESTPTEKLPIIRLNPPGMTDWFLEFLTVPGFGAGEWERLKLSIGHFALRSFVHFPLLTFEPMSTEFGLACARAEMMALTNLLEHPTIKPDTMSAPIAGRICKRSNKDLGRVLAIAWLTGPEGVERWPGLWESALRACFPTEWKPMASRVGEGLRDLLSSDDDLDDALWTCANGLLAHRISGVDRLSLMATGRRVLQDAVEPLVALANGAGS